MAEDKKAPKYPGYTALLPPRVRYDQRLRSTAKLLYAEISAMADVTGFCWASNRYLAALFSVTKGTISELLRQLEERSYIEIQVIRDEKNAVEERRLFITDAGLMRLPPITKNRYTPPRKNPDTPITKNRNTPITKNPKGNDTSLERIPPYSPPKGGRRRAPEHKSAPDWRPGDFARLWEWYPLGDGSLHSKRGNKQRAIRAWDALHPSPELIETIAAALVAQAASEEWKRGVGIPHLSTYLNGYGWEGWEEAGG